MDLQRGHSPKEEGELEDGEICDDETEESLPIRRGDGNRPARGARLRPRKLHQHSHNIPLMGHQPPEFRHIIPYNRPHGHGPFPPAPRQQCGPRGTDRPPAPSPCPLLPLPPPVPPPMPVFDPHGDPCPRTSGFWERTTAPWVVLGTGPCPTTGRGTGTGGPGVVGTPGCCPVVTGPERCRATENVSCLNYMSHLNSRRHMTSIFNVVYQVSQVQRYKMAEIDSCS
ncbi:unnamed protein product [Tetraodon nigroviridis]|uniref:(spotted green pufferfish) hypothetical protein n=1 Tax=Tetraodon nigroviridis TaxID=99883 RepID=Q4TDL5_TETNG|nr:unnamed protein product [Tetraodon nigroviridis]